MGLLFLNRCVIVWVSQHVISNIFLMRSHKEANEWIQIHSNILYSTSILKHHSGEYTIHGYKGSMII